MIKLVGISMGSLIAQGMAAHYPEKIKSLTVALMNHAPRPRE
jgi:pimeloyl-ACP methyl ester carboxylesterase